MSILKSSYFPSRPAWRRRTACLPPCSGNGASHEVWHWHEGAALDLLTVDEAAAMLRTSRKAIYHRIARGQIPAVRLGRSVFIRRGDLATCLVTGE